MYGLDTLIMPPTYLRALKEADRHILNFAQSINDVSSLSCYDVLIAYHVQFMNMDASVGDIGTANAMEIDLVSKYLNPSLRM